MKVINFKPYNTNQINGKQKIFKAMKRSEINQAILEAKAIFEKYNWTLPPKPKWDVTDFGLGNFKENGLILVNLAEEAEYCEKLMYARKGQITPAHCHKKKKEDIIARTGVLVVQVWQGKPNESVGKTFTVNICGEPKTVTSGDKIYLKAGERITLVPQVYHAFYPDTDECIIGEVSTANDDLNDNFFIDPNIGRYATIDEDEPPLVKLVSDKE